MEKGIKKLIWKDAFPYGIQHKISNEIKFNSLHFQGETKRLMGDCYTGIIGEVRW
jgi:hypothetical protein